MRGIDDANALQRLSQSRLVADEDSFMLQSELYALTLVGVRLEFQFYFGNVHTVNVQYWKASSSYFSRPR